MRMERFAWWDVRPTQVCGVGAQRAAASPGETRSGGDRLFRGSLGTKVGKIFDQAPSSMATSTPRSPCE
jgi:hypothetical protein